MTAKPKADQLNLNLTFQPAYGRDDFFEAVANQDALGAVEQSAGWSFPGLIIVGETGSGKTHLATIWANAVGAAMLPFDNLSEVAIASVVGGQPAVIDGVVLEGGEPEARLFRLMNACIHGRTQLLLTTQSHPNHWTLHTADVASRVKLFPVVEIGQPDDGLLTAILMKQLADRQIAVNANAVTYAAVRLERSFSMVAEFVELVDQLAQQTGRKLTRALAREAVMQLSHGGQSEHA